MGNSHSLGAVYAGRFVAGLGVGQTVVVGPVYLAEIVRTSLSLFSRTIDHKLNCTSHQRRYVVCVPVCSLASCTWASSWPILPITAAK